ncbi:MAG: PaaX family transcriptional regulator [Micromonosporaceae bacterium]
MKPRSLVFDLYGDYLRYLGGEAPLRVVVDLLAEFGIPEATARVMMTRLKKEGWLDTRRDGRSTVYALNDRSWQLLDEGRRRIFHREPGAWDRQWRMAIYRVPESDRSARERVRKSLRWLGFGMLAPATWISPHDRLGEVARALQQETSVRLDLLTARSHGAAADLDMARRCWDLEDQHKNLLKKRESYRALLARYRAAPPVGAGALRERTELVHDYRLTLFDDPDLPPELAPQDWVGREVHDLFTEAHDLLRAEAEAHCRLVADTAR